MTMLVYMVGRNIPLYGIDIDAYSNVNVDAQSILLQAISGDMKNCSIFIIGLWPYMLASMLAILIVAIMSLDNTRKLSPKKINIWTVTIMMIIAAVQAYHKTQTLMYRVSGDELIWNKIIVFIQLIAGMLIVVYMCDRATKYGKLNELGLTKDELVLSGASMGTFGSLYYGSKLSPHALLLAKPLANMGNVARNERILRAGGFATSLDILMKNYDNLSDEAIEQLNNRMWDRFDSADWSQTKFIISYLYEDDYDPDGYPSILSHLKSSGVEVYGKTCRYQFKESGRFYTCYMVDDTSDLVHRVEIVSNGCLIRKDFYTYCRTFSEYYAPLDGKAHLYGRTFFNEDGSVCYEEVIEDDSTFYRIGAQVLYTKADLVGYMVKRLNLTADDVVIIDRTTGIGQAILENCGPARVGIVVHADHFSEGGTDDDYILWNNYYEYSFSQTEHIDFYITATDAQNELMRQQFKKYCGKEPHVVTIPVGSLDELKYPDEPRKRHSLITASRLATEKHCDWLVEAVVKAKESVPDISLDIYGKGGDEAKLKRLIGRLGCADYVHLMGQQKLDDVYKHYDAYVAASQSEGFGLTLMEAIGSGLPIVGFDVRYGNQTFIDDGQNGYKIPITDEMDQKEKIKLLSERIVRMFTEDDMDAFSGHSYEKAKEYLTKEVVHRWIELLK